MKLMKLLKKIILMVLVVSVINSTLDPIGVVFAVEEIKDTIGSIELPGSNQNEEIDYSNKELYADGKILIYNQQQLAAIGTGQIVHMNDKDGSAFGTGEVVLDEDGQNIAYSLDATYQLMNDIELDYKQMWSLPEGFKGQFVGNDEVNEEDVLYDQAKDTIHIYNNYQLMTILSDEKLKTVLSGDKIAKNFGTGQIVYTDESQKTQLEYTDAHHYVLDSSFTSEMPELAAQQILETQQTSNASQTEDGRAYEGQVIYYDENDVQYILIGNKQQLEAIGKTDTKGNPIKVTEPVWKQKEKFNLAFKWEEVGGPTIYYKGDADLEEGQELYDAIGNENVEIGKDDGGVLDTVRNKYYGSKRVENSTTYVCDKNTTKNVNMGIKDGFSSEPVYSTTANYIIFRDIDLSGVDWQPMMFSGHMEGRLNMVEGSKPTIKNITVNQSGELNIEKNVGIGFFGTITNQSDTSGSNNQNSRIGLSKETATVKNIRLENVTVQNTSNSVAKDTNIVTGLVGVVGGLLGTVGGILDGILDGILGGILGRDEVLGDLNLSDLLGKLLDAKDKSPDTFATGTFAGRIIGDVHVSGCEVINGSVSNTENMTGGFVGNVEGLTEYGQLGASIDGTVDVLEGLLNVLPGVGLGDLITILLDNPKLFEITEIIPTGYKRAQITDCKVSLSDGNIGTTDTKFNGGFAGM